MDSNMDSDSDENQDRAAAEEDEWLWDSISTYSELHLFDLWEASRTLCFIDGQNVVVGSFDRTAKSLWDLHILHFDEGDNNNAIGDVVSFSSQAFSSLSTDDVHLLTPGMLAVVEQSAPRVSFWEVHTTENNSKKLGPQSSPHVYQFDSKNHYSCVVSQKPAICLGLSCGHLAFLDAHEDQWSVFKTDTVYNESLSGLLAWNETTFVTQNTGGGIYLLDTRTPSTVSTIATPNFDAVAFQKDPFNPHQLVSISSNPAAFLIHDIRTPNVMVSRKPFSGQSPKACVNFEMSPHERGIVSLSGMQQDATVDIFNLEQDDMIPLFQHRGHSFGQLPQVLCHRWHPDIPRCVLSTDNVARLQCWRF